MSAHHCDLAPYYQWAVDGDSGMSSKTLVQATSGAILQATRDFRAPSDTADIGRCIRVLRKFPELRPRLHMVADKAREWPALVANWDELERLYDAIDGASEDYVRNSYALYNRMNELAGWPLAKVPQVRWENGGHGSWFGWHRTRMATRVGRRFRVWKRTPNGYVNMGSAATLAEAAAVAMGSNETVAEADLREFGGQGHG